MARAETSSADHCDLGYDAVGDDIDHFRPGTNDAAPFRLFTHHEAVYVVEENQRDKVLVAIHDKPRGLLRCICINHAAELHPLFSAFVRDGLDGFLLIGDNAHCPAADSRVAAQERLAVLGAVFVKPAAVHYARNDLPHIVLSGGLAGENPVDFICRVSRRFFLMSIKYNQWLTTYFANQRSNSCKAALIVRFAKIYRSADLGMHPGPAQFFCGNLLPDGSLNQSRAGEKESAALSHQDVVAHDGQVSAASHAHTHDGCDLRNAHGAHHGIIAEDTAEIVRIRKNIFLKGQEYPGRIYQVNRRNVIVDSDLLRAQDLLGGHGEECPSLHRSVVCDDHHEPALNPPKACDDSSRRRAAPLLIHFERCENTQFEEAGTMINQQGNTLACRQSPLFVLGFHGLRAAALADGLFLVENFTHQFLHPARVFQK